MARMLSDAARAQALARMIYGDEDSATTAYPAGDERADEQREINRRVPARVGSDSRRMLDQEDREDAEDDELSDVNPPDQFAPVMPPRQMKPVEDALPGNEMVQVPAPLADAGMQALMQQASGNAISRSLGSDGAAVVEPIEEKEEQPRRRRRA